MFKFEHRRLIFYEGGRQDETNICLYYSVLGSRRFLHCSFCPVLYTGKLELGNTGHCARDPAAGRGRAGTQLKPV